jgi:hypothetical protein
MAPAPVWQPLPSLAATLFQRYWLRVPVILVSIKQGGGSLISITILLIH